MAGRGGSRPGAGRKPKERALAVDLGGIEPLDFLLGVMRGQIQPSQEQLRAAITAAQYTNTKKGDGGKKEEKGDAAKRVASGERFAPSAPPKLVAVR